MVAHGERRVVIAGIVEIPPHQATARIRYLTIRFWVRNRDLFEKTFRRLPVKS
jgi:predicted ABC-type exoprotein transport system permease subunit